MTKTAIVRDPDNLFLVLIQARWVERMGKERITFRTVSEIGLTLPGTEVGTAYGSPMLRVNGRIFAGLAVNKQAEPDSLMVYVADFEQRDALISEDPDRYYVKPHYESYPVVLVRLARVDRDVLEDLLRASHRVVSSKPSRRAARSTPKDRAPSTRGARRSK